MKKIILNAVICAICSQAYSQSWNLTGNAGTNGTNNFIGTTDNVAFKIRTNNSVRMTISNAGKVGIGISSPVGKLHVKGNTNVSQMIIDASASQSNSNPLIKLRKSDGTDLMHINSDDSTNLFMGVNAGKMNDTVALNWDGTRNTFIGCHAGASNFHGWENTAIGSFALANNTNGALNTAVGYNALVSNTTGWTNTAFGASTMEYNTTGQANTGCGYRVLNQNTTGQFNTGIGHQALFSNNTGERNSAFGYEALLYNYDGAYNTAGGYHSMRQNTSGSVNTAYGYYTLYSNTTGNWNTATGHQALYSNNGTANTADGLNALFGNTTGNYNTAVGKDAMFYSSTGSYNTILGHAAGCNNGYNPTNFTALGYNAGHLGNNSNTMEIGNASIGWIGGQVGWSTYSDKRIKDNIQSNVPGLEFINKLNPVTYNLNIHRENEICEIENDADWEGKYDVEKIVQTGFIAQEVEAAAKEINFDFNGVQPPKGNAKLYSIQYASFVMPLVKAVQELSSSNEQLKMKNEKLQNELDEMKSCIETLCNCTLETKTQSSQLKANSYLEQNNPNPFKENTTIGFSISSNASKGLLKIFSMNGEEIKSFIIATKGKGQIEIAGNTLSPGVYTYVLIVDDKSVDTKQMIVTN